VLLDVSYRNSVLKVTSRNFDDDKTKSRQVLFSLNTILLVSAHFTSLVRYNKPRFASLYQARAERRRKEDYLSTLDASRSSTDQNMSSCRIFLQTLLLVGCTSAFQMIRRQTSIASKQSHALPMAPASYGWTGKPDKSISNIFEANVRWKYHKLSQDPKFFEKLGSGHAPKYLWIGKSCSVLFIL
jgi:hypothetical protein